MKKPRETPDFPKKLVLKNYTACKELTNLVLENCRSPLIVLENTLLHYGSGLFANVIGPRNESVYY